MAVSGPGNESSVGAQSWENCAHAPSTALAQPQWANEEDAIAVEDLWEKEAYDKSGRHLGRIEAVGMGRNRVPRHVGVRLQGSGSALTFFALTGARLEEGRVIVATEGSLHVLGA